MPRNGRAPSKEPRIIWFRARLSEKENALLEAYATSHNLTKTQVVVKGLYRLKEDDEQSMPG